MSSSGKEMARGKTTVRRGQPNPLFKETFMFQVPQIQLGDVTLMVAVNAVRTLKRRPEMIGWFCLGMMPPSSRPVVVSTARLYLCLGWRVGAEGWASDLRSRSWVRLSFETRLWTSYAPFTKQYYFVPVNARCRSAAGKVTVGLESHVLYRLV